MVLSIASKQYLIYGTLVITTAFASIFVYQGTQTEWIFYRAAETKFENKDFAAAIALYNKSLGAGLPLNIIILNLGQSYNAVGDFTKAIAFYEHYLQKNPKDNKVRLQLARDLSYTGNFEKAELEYKKTLDDSYDQKH